VEGVKGYPLWQAIHAASEKAGHPCNVGLAQVIDALDALASTPNPVRAEQPEGKGMKVGDTIMVPAYVAYPGSRVSDLLIGGRDGPFVQVPNSMLAAAPAVPGVRVDEATLRQALHAMKRCKQESPSGKSWDMPIAKLTAALAPDGGEGEDAVRRVADEMRMRMVGDANHHPKPVYGTELLAWAERLTAALAGMDGAK
jgi:hypothetical protein